MAIGHDAANLGDARVVVVSTAVKRDNPEVVAARARFIPVVRRAEMLAELMRLKWAIAVGGTHGKTTTTSLIACMLEAAHLDPTVINGGIINAYGTNTRMGDGEWMVVEADESDGSFLRLPAVIAVVTNMDPEHLDHWGTPEAMIAGYDQFVANIPFYGFAVLCIDHPAVQQMIPRLSDRRIITYGFSPQADVRADKVRPDKAGSTFEVVVTDRARSRSAAWARSACRCWASTTCRTRSPRSPSAWRWKSATRSCATRSSASRASSAASPAPARPAASPSSTTTATIRWRSPPC